VIGKAVFTRLSGDTNVSALVGTRIFPNDSKSNDLPQIIYQLRGLEVGKIYGGFSGMDTIELHIFCLSTDYDSVMSLINAVQTSLDGQSGTWGDKEIYLVDQTELNDNSEIDAEADEITLYDCELVYSVKYKH